MNPKTNPGHFFEDFRVGQRLVHATPRTVTAGDVALYTALYGTRFAVNSSAAFAGQLGLPEVRPGGGARVRLRRADAEETAMSGILDGLRMIEGAAFVAAPLCGMTLGQLGADVIRFDPLEGGLDARRWPVTRDGRSLVRVFIICHFKEH